MSWFSENKFLAGFIGATVIGVGGMGWLTFSTSSKHSAAMQEYETAQNELKSLQEQRPFPKAENLKLAEEEKKQTLAMIQKLQGELAATGFPLAEMSASDFQIELKKTLDVVVQKSAQNAVELPKEKFNLGFDYLAQLPDQAAAKPLGRELKAIAWVANLIVDGGAVKLEEIKRQPIEEEKEPPKPDKNQRGPAGPQKQTAEKPLTRRDVFEVTFKADQRKANKILNDIVASKEQFYIPRRVRIENEITTPPSKVDPSAPKPSNDGGNGTTEAPKPSGITPILGREKVVMSIELEAVYFTAPELKPANRSTPQSN